MRHPVLMLTYNRLEYTKQSLEALINCNNTVPFVIDNGSEDGTVEYLREKYSGHIPIIFNGENMGIAFAMNQFLASTADRPIVGKIDNDTLVERDWCNRMLPYLEHADIIQSRHHIIPATCPGGWNQFVSKMRFKDGLYFNHYVGGSGVLFRRDKVTKLIPETENKIMGWRRFQAENPQLVKAFVNDVEIKLLDDHGYGDFPQYYKETGRI